MTKSEIRRIQKKIGYEFKNSDLLIRAFTRHSATIKGGGECNESSEWLGDAVLGFAVSARLYEQLPQSTENPQAVLTEERKKYVCKEALAKQIDRLGFMRYLISGNGNAEKESDSEKIRHNLFEAILGAVAIDSDYDSNTIRRVTDQMLNFRLPDTTARLQ